MRGSKPLNPAAFLIDQDRRVRVLHRLTKGCYQRPYLLGGLNIAFEENKTPRARLLKEGALLVGQRRAGATENAGCAHTAKAQLLTKQILPLAFSESQKAAADVRSAKPLTEVR